MKIYVTKYALTKGKIYEVEGLIDLDGGYAAPTSPEWFTRGFAQHLYTGEWADNLPDARDIANDMRTKEVAKLEKKIRVLNSMNIYNRPIIVVGS